MIDTKLADEGIQQAKDQAKTFYEAGVKFSMCATSPLQRAAVTASILAESHGVTPVKDERLAECSLGEFEGLSRSVIYGPKYSSIFGKLAAMPHEKRVHSTYFAGLETPKDISDRVTRCIVSLAKSARPREIDDDDDDRARSILLVSHSVILKSLLAVQFGKYYEGIRMRTLSWMHINIDDGGKLRLVNSDGIEFTDEFSPEVLIRGHHSEGKEAAGDSA